MARRLTLVLTAEVQDDADDIAIADHVMEWVCYSEPPKLVYFDSCEPAPPDRG